jgi:hypothetical protein
MVFKVGTLIPIKYYHGSAGITIYYKIFDETGALFSGPTTMSAHATETGLYEGSFTPDVAGNWFAILYYGTVKIAQVFYDVGGAYPTVKDNVIYLVAEDLGTTELTDNGDTPVYLGEISETHATEGAGESSPAWTEDYNLEQAYTYTLISMFMYLEAAVKLTGAGTAYAKFQMTGDGGVTWVDVTNTFSTTSTIYVPFVRMGVGIPFATITAGTNKLGARLVAWTSATSVQTKVRSTSYVRITWRAV